MKDVCHHPDQEVFHYDEMEQKAVRHNPMVRLQVQTLMTGSADKAPHPGVGTKSQGQTP